MLLKNSIAIMLVLVLTVVYSGCYSNPKPADLPKLYTCQITVTQEGQPLGRAVVTLFSENTDSRWAVFAQLDESGSGKVFTQGLYPGAPEGNYKVVIKKEEEEGQTTSVPLHADNDDKMPLFSGAISVFSHVEKQYTDASTTPLQIAVEKKHNEYRFDCGKPVRILLRKVEP